MAYTYEQLHAMTVAQLREIAQGTAHEAVKGASTMHKEKLLPALCLALGIDLTLEQGTPLGRWAERGLLPIPDADRVADMYEWASERLSLYDFEQYEISNWSKPGRECRHIIFNIGKMKLT